jgi:hypothetical protein
VPFSCYCYSPGDIAYSLLTQKSNVKHCLIYYSYFHDVMGKRVHTESEEATVVELRLSMESGCLEGVIEEERSEKASSGNSKAKSGFCLLRTSWLF